MLTRIDHVGIACHDLDEKVAFYESLFELTVTSREVSEAQGVREAMLRVADSPGGSSWIQLLEPLAADTPVGRFLARRGEGIHHIGYGVNDITQALASIGASGVRLLDTRPRHGSMGASIAFIHPADVGGVLTELVEVDNWLTGIYRIARIRPYRGEHQNVPHRWLMWQKCRFMARGNEKAPAWACSGEYAPRHWATARDSVFARPGH